LGGRGTKRGSGCEFEKKGLSTGRKKSLEKLMKARGDARGKEMRVVTPRGDLKKKAWGFAEKNKELEEGGFKENQSALGHKAEEGSVSKKRKKTTGGGEGLENTG